METCSTEDHTYSTYIHCCVGEYKPIWVHIHILLLRGWMYISALCNYHDNNMIIAFDIYFCGNDYESSNIAITLSPLFTLVHMLVFQLKPCLN